MNFLKSPSYPNSSSPQQYHNPLIRFFATRHLLVNVLTLAILALGYFFIKDVPREYIPAISTPIINITAQLPGASARDIETKLTIPIQDALEDVDGIDVYSSIASDNTSLTVVELYLDFSDEQIAEILQDIRDAIDGITDFPVEMDEEPIIEQFDPDSWPVVEIALSGNTQALAPYAKRLERKLDQIPQIAQATIVGLPDPEIRVLVHPDSATEHRVTLLDVVDAITRRNVSATGGVLETATDRKQVVLWSRYLEPADVGSTILRSSRSGGTLRINDIARIEETREDTTLITHTDAETGMSIVLRKRKNADAINLVDAAKAALEANPPPSTVRYKLVNDRSFYTRNRLAVITTNGLLGAVLVAAVLFLFMRGHASIWVLAGIPIVFMGALAVFGNTGLSLNLFTLTGFVLVLGMVVDDAVVVAERIATHRDNGMPSQQAAIFGASEMVRPVIAAALTTILAFLPLTALGGLPGKLVWQIPAVVVLVLLFSVIESFCVLPAHMSSGKQANNALAQPLGKRRFMVALEALYAGLITKLVRFRVPVVSAFLALLVFIFLVIAPRVAFVLFPQDDARSLYLKVSAPIGTPLEQTEAIVTNLEQQIIDITGDELTAVIARIGHQDALTSDRQRGEAENQGVVTAIFRDLDRTHTNAEWIAILQDKLTVAADVTLLFQSEYIGPPTDQPVTLHLMSNDDQLRRSVALDIRSFLRDQPGLVEVDVDERPGTPQLDLNLDYEKLALLGLDAFDVSQTLAAAFHGIEASEHRSIDDTTKLRVQFDPAARSDLNGLLDTPVRARDGSLVLLRNVVNPVEIPAVSRIFHRNGFRSSTIRASFAPDSGHTALSYAQFMRDELLPKYQALDLEFTIGGEAQRTEETTGEIGSAAILVVLGIGVVIWLLLGSFVEALFVMVVIPFAIAGVIVTFFLHGKPLSMTAMMGAIGLAGVVVNASIVMVDSIHRRASQQPNAADNEPLIAAVVERLRPILVTTLTTLGGVLPTAYGLGGYDSIVSPMSLALGWGLAFSTLVTLFLVPPLYSIARDLSRGKRQQQPQRSLATPAS